MADEFLFPMTSRASYSSSYPDSDGEFCEPETPVVSRQPSVIMDVSKLERYSSDPNLHDKKSIKSGVIPDYNAPPPNSAMNVSQQAPKVVTTTRSSTRPSYTTLPLHSQTDSVDELPLPPTPLNAIENPYRYESIPEPAASRRRSRTSASSISSKRSQSQPPKSLPPAMMPKQSPPSPPVQAPPSIERNKKPNRLPRESGYHTYSARRQHSTANVDPQGSLDRRAHLRDLRMTVYDAYGNGQPISTPPSAASAVATTNGNNGIYATTSRYSHRSQEYHSLMSMSSNAAKPVPPPKPKSYPYHHRSNGTQQHLASTSFVEGTYMNSLPPNGTYSNTRQINDDDSGQGSSLDRDYAIYNNDQQHHHQHRYANTPMTSNYANGASPSMMKHGHHHQYGLDLTNNREYRSSAFELYKKPANGHHSPHENYQNSVW